MLNRLHVGLTIALLASSFAMGCKKDDGGGGGGSTTGGSEEGGSENTGGRTGGASNTGGSSEGGETATGGSTAGGETATGGTTAGGETATGGVVEETGGTGVGGGETGGGGTGGTVTGDATIDDLISAICTWEFGCCDDGETTYRLGPSSLGVQDCIDDFSYQYHTSNTTSNPYPAGTATGLLGLIGYTVNPDYVTENPAGIQDCIDAWEAAACPSNAAGPGYCEATYMPGTGACSLVHLFDPALAVGDECTLALAEGGDGNDVECPLGSTCLVEGDPDNPEGNDACVTRGLEGEPCTEDVDCDWNFYCNAAGDCTEKGDVDEDCSFDVPATPMPDDEDVACKAGLRCNPVSLTCVANCMVDYPCVDYVGNSDCPEGLVCAPTTVGEDSVNWHTCQPIGTGASARCDDAADCVETRRCSGGVCQADVNIGDPCGSDADCESGSYCDLAIWDPTGWSRSPTSLCVQNANAGEPCFPVSVSEGYASGCAPSAPSCAYDGTDGQWECTTAKRPEDAYCYPYEIIGIGYPNEPSDCAAGLHCELVEGFPTYTCTQGASLGDACDTVVDDSTELDCGVGLWCDPDGGVSGPECVAQLNPGENCDNPQTAAAAAESNLCLNGACVTNWDTTSTAPDFICSDAPIPVLNTGDGLTCNG